MLLLIIFAVFLILAAITIIFSNRDEYTRTRTIKFYGAIFLLCTIAFCCISFFVDSNKDNIVEFSDKAELAQTIEIECLNDNLNTTGKISGNIFSVKGYEKQNSITTICMMYQVKERQQIKFLLKLHT